jgi:hypothetical protein
MKMGDPKVLTGMRQVDRMYYNIVLARESITIQSSSNVLMMGKRKEGKKL